MGRSRGGAGRSGRRSSMRNAGGAENFIRTVSNAPIGVTNTVNQSKSGRSFRFEVTRTGQNTYDVRLIDNGRNAGRVIGSTTTDLNGVRLGLR